MKMSYTKNQQEAIDIAEYILNHDCTVSAAAKHFGFSLNKTQYRLDHQLRDIDEAKYRLIREGYVRHKKQKNKYIWHFVCNGNPDKGHYFVRLKNGTYTFAFVDYNGYYWLIDGTDITDEVGAWIEPEQLMPKEWR